MLRMLFVVISILLLLNACSSGDQLTQLVGTEWSVTSLLGKSLNAAEITKGLPSLNFSDNGKLFGSTGCNNFTGSYKLEGTKLSLDPGAMTKMMCSDNTEQDFLNAINQVTNIKQDGNTLDLLNGAKTVMSLISKTK
jgi:heat shock protein HslJ